MGKGYFINTWAKATLLVHGRSRPVGPFLLIHGQRQLAEVVDEEEDTSHEGEGDEKEPLQAAVEKQVEGEGKLILVPGDVRR
jgi:hypothetical protein